MNKPLRYLLLLLAIDLILVGGYLLWAHNILAQPRPATPFDSGVLFFADFDPNGGLGPRSRRRTNHAARLYASGSIRHLIIVGGHRQRPQRFGATLMAAQLHTQGVPDSAMDIDRQSFDTVGNWRVAITLLQARHAPRALLISDPLHLLRIRTIATRSLPITLAPTRSITTIVRQQPLQTWLRVHREWVAWLAMAILPQDLHQSLLRSWRDFWNPAGSQPEPD